MNITTSEIVKAADGTALQVSQPILATKTATTPLRRVRQFVRDNLIGSITVTIAGSLILTGYSTWNTWNIYKSFRSTVNQQFQLEKLSGKIVHLDEVLTMSARMAASTGDLKWEARYNQYVPELDAAIQETLANVTPEIRSQASQTDAANKKLVDLETQAFNLVRQRKAKAALQLLLGPEYTAQKQIYAAGNQQVLNSIEQLIQQQLSSYQQQLFSSMAFAGVTLPILLGIWILVLSAVRDYIRDRQQAQQALQSSQDTLLVLNQELQQEAAMRQQQETQIRQESEQLQDDISHLLEVVCSIEEGNLTVEAEVNDRATGLIGDTLNRLVEELSRILSQVSTAAERVSRGTHRQKAIAATVAQSTSNQAQSVMQVLSLTETVRQAANSGAAQLSQTNQALLMLQAAVAAGQGTISSLTQEIGVLQQGSDHIVQQMKTLGEFVGLADQFVEDQGEIVIQTQVLAMNASLVAARAAEQRDPKQFAAVAREFELIADQVSQLAQKTNEGLADLEQRSTQIHRVVSDVDQEVQRLGGLVDSFTSGVKQTREVFQTVQTVTGETVQAGNTVAQTSQTIVEAADSTAAAMDAISVLARQIAQQSHHAQRISDQITSLSETLLQNVNVFTLPTAGTDAVVEEVLPNSDAEPVAPELVLAGTAPA